MTPRILHKIGLTGSIGMGKSTVAGFFEEAGVPVWDADAAVHQLYDDGGAGVEAIRKLVPDAIIENSVDRAKLSTLIKQDPDLLAQIEDVIHPLVAQDRQAFVEHTDAPFALCDIPLLFENEMQGVFDTVIVVSASEKTQRERVLGREGMTPEKFAFILSRQMPDIEKRKRADFVIETDVSFEDTRKQVLEILAELGRDDT